MTRGLRSQRCKLRPESGLSSTSASRWAGRSRSSSLSRSPRRDWFSSPLTSVRDMASEHYSFLPKAAVPDAYPSKERIGRLKAPLLVVHGECDEIIPVDHGRVLYETAPEPKRLQLVPNVGHNDFLSGAGSRFAETVAGWVSQ